jgi:DNA-binding NtrC family response regulator
MQDMNFSLQTSGEEGLQLLTTIKQRYPNLPVLLMSAWGSINLAVRGVKLGAADFFTKPWQNAQVLELVQTSLALNPAHQASAVSRQSLDQQYDFSALIGEHPDFLKVLATIARVAKTNASVLILGESGTGKELVADAIHKNSPRAAQALVKVNMGAIISSLFESEMFGHVRGAFTDAKSDKAGYFTSAQQGSLFLDEIGELHRGDQVKLLRVLQNQSFQAVGATKTQHADVRIISATNQELAELVANGTFREDLFYRLNLITLRLPALRDRRSDIPILAQRILAQLCQSYGMETVTLSASALTWLSQAPWPGNIRQLKQTLERSLLMVDKPVLEERDFQIFDEGDNPAPVTSLGVDGMTLDQVERLMIVKAMEQHQGNMSRVAKSLGLSRFALYRRLEKYQIMTQEKESEISSDAARETSQDTRS